MGRTLTSHFKGGIEYASVWTSESCRLVNDIKPAAQIGGDVVHEAEEIVEQITGLPRGV